MVYSRSLSYIYPNKILILGIKVVCVFMININVNI